MGLPPSEPSAAIIFIFFNKAPFASRYLRQDQEQKAVDFGLTKEQELLLERVDPLVQE